MGSLWPTALERHDATAQPERRYLSLYLPRWATDCLKRADPALAELAVPFALWERIHNTLTVVAVDDAAARLGLYEGQNLSDARALVPNLFVREIDRFFLIERFADFADWHSYASPIVSVLEDESQFGDLVIDITGAAHLFGGEERMLATVTDRLRNLGFSVLGGVADSVGAAWALSHYAPGRIVAGDDTRAVISSLPVAALRLSADQVDSLKQMGLKRIADLFGRDRRALQARFGAVLLLRLDQALGDIEERVTPRIPVAECYAERRFPDPIGLVDDVLMTAHDLAVALGERLHAQGEGAQTFHLFLYRVDHQVITLSVNAGRATRNPGHISRLFAHRTERLDGDYDAGFGIDMIRLAASSLSRLDDIQAGAFEEENGTEDLELLFDRMTSRLGPLAVVRNKFVNTHIPERAVRLEPVIARTPDDPHAAPDLRLKRPLRLLPAPEPIAVSLAEVPDGPPPNMIWRRVNYRFVRTSGPERIGIEWWTLPQPLAKAGDNTAINDGSELTRDYYIAEDDGGRRFWLFREGLYTSDSQRWFLHGFFA